MEWLEVSLCPGPTATIRCTTTPSDPNAVTVVITSDSQSTELYLATDSGGMPVTAIRLHAVLTDAITRAGYAHELARPETP